MLSRQLSISFPSWNQYGRLSHTGPEEITMFLRYTHYMSILSRERLISLHFLLQSQQGDIYLSLHVERPGKHIAPSCATLTINQKWSLMTSLKSTNVIPEKTPSWFSVKMVDRDTKLISVISVKLGNVMEMIFDYRRSHIGDKSQWRNRSSW